LVVEEVGKAGEDLRRGRHAAQPTHRPRRRRPHVPVLVVEEGGEAGQDLPRGRRPAPPPHPPPPRIPPRPGPDDGAHAGADPPPAGRRCLRRVGAGGGAAGGGGPPRGGRRAAHPTPCPSRRVPLVPVLVVEAVGEAGEDLRRGRHAAQPTHRLRRRILHFSAL